MLTDTEEQALFSEPLVPTTGRLRESNRNWGHIAIAMMCIGGLLVVWLYGSGTKILDSSLLDTLIQKTDVQSVFANPAQIGIMSVIAMVIALWVALRRRTQRIQIPV